MDIGPTKKVTLYWLNRPAVPDILLQQSGAGTPPVILGNFVASRVSASPCNPAVHPLSRYVCNGQKAVFVNVVVAWSGHAAFL